MSTYNGTTHCGKKDSHQGRPVRCNGLPRTLVIENQLRVGMGASFVDTSLVTSITGPSYDYRGRR